jgi:serpin B
MLTPWLRALLFDAAKPGASPEGSPSFATCSNEFGFDLYRRLAAAPGNNVVSPASISISLAMPWVGARGKTAAQMKQVLYFQDQPGPVIATAGELTRALIDPKRPGVFRIANRLFGEKTFPFEPVFLEATRAAFGAGLEPTDFHGAPEAARQAINLWVLEQTNQRIRDPVPPGGVSRETGLVLVNALYFLGDWASPFEHAATSPAPFHLSAREERLVPTMHNEGYFHFAARNGLLALKLQCKGGLMSMLLLLPEAREGLAAAEKSLDAAGLAAIVKSLSQTRVDVALPRFEVNPTNSLSLRKLLVALGMGAAFDPAQADFSGIANPPDPKDRLVIGDVFQKAFVKVDEKGTEAVAATAAGSVCLGDPPVPFTADHPFLFFILDDATGLVVFMGRVSDPSQK